MVYGNTQAVCVRAVMALPKQDTVVDCRAANKHVKEVPAPTVNVERMDETFAGAQALFTEFDR